MESSLEQLLDCPICFERLGGSNRVLPCQHTFCKDCLWKIKKKYKELRCPECRALYNGYIENLPCNILVMRILEQLKQEAQKSKSINNLVKQSLKTDKKLSLNDNERKNYLSNAGNLSTDRDSMFRSSTTVDSRIRSSRAGTTSVRQELTNNIGNPFGHRKILGAIRKQDRNREDNTRNSSMFVRSLAPSSTSNTESNDSTRGNSTGIIFSPNSYTFSIELKTSNDRCSSTTRRANKNYVKPSILTAVSNQNTLRISTRISDANTSASLSLITPSTSQSTVPIRSTQNNYLSFTPNCYTFNVDLKSDNRSTQQKKKIPHLI